MHVTLMLSSLLLLFPAQCDARGLYPLMSVSQCALLHKSVRRAAYSVKTKCTAQEIKLRSNDRFSRGENVVRLNERRWITR